MSSMMDNFYDSGRKGLAARTFAGLFAAVLVVYFVSRNWSWYKNDLSDDGIRPDWASEYINVIIWSIWYITFGWLWSYHLRHHPDARMINMMYLLLLGLTFIWQVYMFEKRSFTFAKWVATLSLFVLAYLLYDAYTRGLYMVVFAMLVHTLIVFWSVVQLWYSDSKYNALNGGGNCHENSGSCSEYSHPWSSEPGYATWYNKPKSHGKSSCSSKKWW